MSILLVDIGNTRVKWASFVRGRVGRMQAIAHDGRGGERIARHIARGVSTASGADARTRGPPKEVTASDVRLRGRAAAGSTTDRLERVVVVSVAGARVNRAFAAEVRRRLGIVPEFFRSERRAAGITTMYGEPWRLGADRLVGVIGAFHLSRHRPVMVASVGTTMTLDFVDASGRHRGGAIVPAPALKIDSLLWGTHGIRRRARGGRGSRGLFARSTRSAISEGARFAAAAVVDRAVLEARELARATPLVLLTGGAAPEIARLIRTRHRYVPDLVLQGLAVIASARPGRA
jgi:type III pantothenate kinase